MTLEELLNPVTKSYWESHQFENALTEEGEYVSVDDCAYAIKNLSGDFAEWIEEKHYWKSTDTRFPNTLGRWTDKINGDVPFEETYTTEELFNIFIKQYKP